MVNSNPETVSTDYDTSDRLYFEPLTLEDVLNVIEAERPDGVIVQFGGKPRSSWRRPCCAGWSRPRAKHRLPHLGHLAPIDRSGKTANNSRPAAQAADSSASQWHCPQ